MYELQALQSNPQELLSQLELFEACCLGQAHLSPDEFKSLNIELSVGTVLHIGRRVIRSMDDGRHLIWISPDDKEHDLGLIDNMNVFRDYPGFNRGRSLCLGQKLVENYEVIEVPGQANITRIEMKDGTFAVGPNYRMALRNAALKTHLTRKFNFFSFGGFIKNIVGSKPGSVQ